MRPCVRFLLWKYLLCRGFIITFLLVPISGCDDFLDVSLSKSLITSENIFSNDITATAAVTAMYNSLANSSPMSGTPTGMSSLMGLSSAELLNYPHTPDLLAFEQYNLISKNSYLENVWNFAYNLIYQANVIIERLQDAQTLSPTTVQQLEGEARFMRAFTYFYLVNLFGDVPLVIESDYRKNQMLPRVPTRDVYALIESDLLKAQSLLGSQYVTGDRVRPNKATATALLSRVYLYQQKYQQAEVQASAVLADNAYVLHDNLDEVFLVKSREIIWQIMPVDPNYNTMEGQYFILTSTPSYNILSADFVGHFEPDDIRPSHWIKSYSNSYGTFLYPYKYKRKSKLPADSFSEYSVVFRLAEIYLIRAEARANLDNLSGAQADLNEIRARAGLGDTHAADQPGLLLAIENERYSELFTEYGHRWLDLKRTGRALSVLGNGITENDLLYPIPFAEFQKNPNLGLQNNGY